MPSAQLIVLPAIALFAAVVDQVYTRIQESS
jgi:hypothetical protein